MARKPHLGKSGLTQWVVTDSLSADEEVARRCSVEVLQEALAGFEGLTVTSASVNHSGEFTVPASPLQPVHTAEAAPRIGNLPAFCDIRIEQRAPGGHTVTFYVWAPLAWNGRFLATGGAGSLTGPLWFEVPTCRAMTMPVALRNGFVTAATNAGNVDDRVNDWALRKDSGTLDWDLIENWVHRSTHDMAEVSKAVIVALYGTGPEYSYYVGGSGGGRQGLASAQRHSGDFDGIWISDPAMNWNTLNIAILWPALAMKLHDNILPPAKLDAFRAAVLEALDGADGVRDGFLSAAETIEFDPETVIGTPTTAGEVTKIDAVTMQAIWDGPRAQDGRQLAAAPRPGSKFWTSPEKPGVGSVLFTEVEGELKVTPSIAVNHVRWVAEDPEASWEDLTLDGFWDLCDTGAQRLAAIDSDDDLTSFRASGGKLLITQAIEDEVLRYQEVLNFYLGVVQRAGGQQEASSFVRMFLSDGDIHGYCIGAGAGVSLAAGTTALMKWVEDGEEPQVMVAERFDVALGEVTATRPVYAYPEIPRYRGEGDPKQATSYEPVRMS
ncbi:tannase/feruloyl esterase family alpha/beta hydrolase [Kineosporia babensis]|uniref:Tannase/feruloyl esterase family alpha/beta hydrolase n=1 Tax=Kineosporia babensis TaxID=499548 RepID=A0A9X1NKH1_9ACTN|nr:tannase/feruloyl esterase family alpha/beta hydrolase [Kineosporia babensis]MCD5316622.1 tannase/feruloyl esterase family alpha/beta hydrolase [Kineosporia babensis]